MKVKELIEKLQRYDPALEIRHSVCHCVHSLSSVEVSDNWPFCEEEPYRNYVTISSGGWSEPLPWEKTKNI